MTRTIKLAVLCIIIFTIQSCTKDFPVNALPDDKLLLSNVSGTFVCRDWYGINAFEYNTQGMFNTNYVYGKKQGLVFNYRPLEKIKFIPNEYNVKGNWDFNYKDNYLTGVSDSTYPPRFGKVWRFTYNEKNQLEETNIINGDDFASDTYQHYVYDNKNQVVEILYGPSKAELYFKLSYHYDAKGILTDFEGFFDAGPASRLNDEVSRVAGKADLKVPSVIRRLQEVMRHSARTSASSAANFVSYFKTTIISDNNINPFEQQHNILFYPSNHDVFYVNDYFLPLIKTNPVKVVTVFAAELGGSAITQEFKYTYNSQKYPVTIVETEKDPLPWQFGDYVRTSKLTYISNN